VGSRNPRITQPHPISLSSLTYAQPTQIHLHDGEIVLFRRGDSPLWQCRYKLRDGTWHRVSTKRASIEHAVAIATELYDEARFRQRLDLAHETRTFAQIAIATVDELRRQLDAGTGKSVYQSYITCIERYFLPYFADQRFEELTHKDIIEFAMWRNRQMGKTPRASTLNNFSSAWSRLQQTAVSRGWISDRAAIPKLSTQGLKSKPRPAFTRREIDQLLTFMATWAEQGRLAVEREIRPLLRDYVEMLLYTGMRHGTEALSLRWCDVSWHEDKGQRYLRLWVDGKTGGRFIIAKHTALAALKRLLTRQQAILGISFDCIFDCRLKRHLFALYTDNKLSCLNDSIVLLIQDRWSLTHYEYCLKGLITSIDKFSVK
jgi:integrase